jgi:high-affinity iron transporter
MEGLKRIVRSFALFSIVLVLVVQTCVPALAQSQPAWQGADTIQRTLNQAQLALFNGDSAKTQALVAEAIAVADSLSPALSEASQAALSELEAALEQASVGAAKGEAPRFTAAKALIQTQLYRIGYEETLAAIRAGDAASAKQWLLVRTFRHASRFERLKLDASETISQLQNGELQSQESFALVQTELLDTYQAQLNLVLHDLNNLEERDLASSRAQQAAFAKGYFSILASIYREQRGDQAAANTLALFDQMVEQAGQGQSVASFLPEIDTALRGFRAAPLSAAEQQRRASQLLRFTALIAVEYERGVKGNMVTIPLEIDEAATFRDGASAAFSDLRSLLEERDPAKTQEVADLFAGLEKSLLEAKKQSSVTDPSQIQASVDQIGTLLGEIMPAEWQQHDTSADFDIIQASLDQIEQAVAAGEFELAESARLDAYAVLESGPEAKLQAFAAHLVQPIEDAFWYGADGQSGLASLIKRKAPLEEFQTTRKELNGLLSQAEEAISGQSAPGAVLANAALIVFREGLEAVLILASLLGSMKVGTQRSLRKPLWIGTVLALAATVLTWILARGLLSTLARYGERLEAVVSLIAVAVLLLIMNWFFHDVYWTGWMANFHRQKKSIIGGDAGQSLGLVVLGFASIYREGFETVLFLQALVLESGTALVLSGVAIGLLGTVGIGLLVFVVQAKLPHKKMLIFTGVLLVFVLVQMVGNTIHVMQVVGWMSINPIRWLTPYIPYWMGMWFGLYGTWEGIGFQLAAGLFTVGSYFLAEHSQKRSIANSIKQQAKMRTP